MNSGIANFFFAPFSDSPSKTSSCPKYPGVAHRRCGRGSAPKPSHHVRRYQIVSFSPNATRNTFARFQEKRLKD